MAARDLSRLFRPRSIAVIGGGDVARYVIENCKKIGFQGALWHVHPNKGAFKSVLDLPHAPDAVFIGVNRMATLEIVAQLRQIGAGGGVVYASGFLEAVAELEDGATVQRQLLEAAGEFPVIGPNCYGFINYLDGAALWPDQQGGGRVERGVALITQSSNIAINLTMQRRGVPISFVVTAGNQAQLGLSQLGQALLEDERVTALGLHIEGVGDLREFEALAARARALGKSIVAVKAGKSAKAQAATISHTASLAGSSAGATALFRRLGGAEVESLSVMLETLKILHATGPLKSNRIASMSCSGGEASLMADAVIDRDLCFPDLNAQQADALRAALGSKVALANPLDYHTYIWADAAAMSQTYSAMMLADLGIGIVVSDFPRNDLCSDADWRPVIEGVKYAAVKSGLPMAIMASLPENMPEFVAKELIAHGIVPLCGMDDGLRAVEASAALGQRGAGDAPILLPMESAETKTLSEADGKALLTRFGADCPISRVTDLKNAPQAAEEIGFPCVLKGQGVAHKTEAGAVALNLMSAAAVEDAAKRMGCTDFLVEEMITDSIVELLVGVVRDPAHGFVLTLAAGGTLTEVLKDSVSFLLPVSEAEVVNGLNALQIAPVLHGFRGADGVNVAAILNAIMAIQDCVHAYQGRLDEIEINPLICTKERAIVADVLMQARLD